MESDVAICLKSIRQKADDIHGALVRMREFITPTHSKVDMEQYEKVLLQYDLLVTLLQKLLRELKPRLQHTVVYPIQVPSNQDPNILPELLRIKPIPELEMTVHAQHTQRPDDFKSEEDIFRYNRTCESVRKFFEQEREGIRASLKSMPLPTSRKTITPATPASTLLAAMAFGDSLTNH